MSFFEQTEILTTQALAVVGKDKGKEFQDRFRVFEEQLQGILATTGIEADTRLKPIRQPYYWPESDKDETIRKRQEEYKRQAEEAQKMQNQTLLLDLIDKLSSKYLAVNSILRIKEYVKEVKKLENEEDDF